MQDITLQNLKILKLHGEFTPPRMTLFGTFLRTDEVNTGKHIPYYGTIYMCIYPLRTDHISSVLGEK